MMKKSENVTIKDVKCRVTGKSAVQHHRSIVL